jgi:uncharacterized protein (DUF1501 family)
MQHFHILSRRTFLSQTFKTSMAVALSTLVDIPFVMKRALAEGNIGLNGKKILFIWLRGANDGLNSVIPVGDDTYYSIRQQIAIQKEASVNYAGTTGGCFDATQYASDAAQTLRGANDNTYSYANAIRLSNGFAALHPSLKFLAPLYNAGDLALIHRVAYPKQSRSHFDSQNYWENGNPNNNLSKDGIFYRAIMESGLANTAPLTGVSIQSALPLILRGSDAAMTNLTSPTRYNILGVPTPAGDYKADAAIGAANYYPFPAKRSRELLALQYQNMSNTLRIFENINFSQNFGDNVNTDGDTGPYNLFPNSNATNGGYALHGNNANKYVVPTNYYGFFNNLKAAALVLNKTDAIIAGTELGGFDTHQNQGGAAGAHSNLQRVIGWSMYALRKYFQNYSDKATWDNTIVITLSEFGRTSVENSDDGTDHAEAGVMFVAGGGVQGRNNPLKSTTNTHGVFGCSTSEGVIAWKPNPRTTQASTCGTMFAAGFPESATTVNPVTAGYLRRSCDFRSVLGEIIRDHLGATQNQLNRIIPGYANPGEALLSGGVSSVDGVQIRGEVGIL